MEFPDLPDSIGLSIRNPSPTNNHTNPHNINKDSNKQLKVTHPSPIDLRSPETSRQSHLHSQQRRRNEAQSNTQSSNNSVISSSNRSVQSTDNDFIDIEPSIQLILSNNKALVNEVKRLRIENARLTQIIDKLVGNRNVQNLSINGTTISTSSNSPIIQSNTPLVKHSTVPINDHSASKRPLAQALNQSAAPHVAQQPSIIHQSLDIDNDQTLDEISQARREPSLSAADKLLNELDASSDTCSESVFLSNRFTPHSEPPLKRRKIVSNERVAQYQQIDLSTALSSIRNAKQFRYEANAVFADQDFSGAVALYNQACASLNALIDMIEHVASNDLPENDRVTQQSIINEFSLSVASRITAYFRMNNIVDARKDVSHLLLLRPTWYKTHSLHASCLEHETKLVDASSNQVHKLLLQAVAAYNRALDCNPSERDRLRLVSKLSAVRQRVATLTDGGLPFETLVDGGVHDQSVNQSIRPHDDQSLKHLRIHDNQSIKPPDDQSIKPSPVQEVNPQPSVIAKNSAHDADQALELRDLTFAIDIPPSPTHKVGQPIDDNMSTESRLSKRSPQSRSSNYQAFPLITISSLTELLGLEILDEAYSQTDHISRVKASVLGKIDDNGLSSRLVLHARWREFPSGGKRKRDNLDAGSYTSRDLSIEFKYSKVADWHCDCLSSRTHPSRLCVHMAASLLVLKAKQEASSSSSEQTTPLEVDTEHALSDQQLERSKTLYQMYEAMSSQQLGQILAANHLSTTGKKSQLVARCVECNLRGVPDNCPRCNGHTFYANGMYHCKGRYDADSKRVEYCSWHEAHWSTTPWRAPDDLE